MDSPAGEIFWKIWSTPQYSPNHCAVVTQQLSKSKMNEKSLNSILGNVGSWFNVNLAGSNPLSRLLVLSIFTSLIKPASPSTTSYIASGIIVLILGALLEIGRRFCGWIYERFKLFRELIWFCWFSVLLEFDCPDFSGGRDIGLIKRSPKTQTYSEEKGNHWSRKIHLTYVLMSVFSCKVVTDTVIQIFRIYSQDVNALSDLIEDARQLYLRVSQPNVAIHSVGSVCRSTVFFLYVSAQY